MVRFIDAVGRIPLSEEILEIETKSGRFFHIQPSSRTQSVALRAGPATPPDEAAQEGGERRDASAGSIRSWRDLTDLLSGAFDARPVVQEIHRECREGAADNPNSAQAWTLRLSTGYAITYGWHQGALQLAGVHGGAQETP